MYRPPPPHAPHRAGGVSSVAVRTALGVVLPAVPALAADSATITPSTTHQAIAGFGFAEAFGQASAVMNAPSSEQQQAFNLLLSTTSGAGLDIIRNEISADPGTTIEPNNPGSPGSPGATPNYARIGATSSNSGVQNPASGLCLDDANSNTANGTQLDIWTCSGGTNQQWHLP
jgi:O-glycosyl hydrolase